MPNPGIYNLPGGNDTRKVKSLNGVCCYENALEENKHDLDCDNHEVNLELYYRRTGKIPIRLMKITSEMLDQPPWIWK